MEAVSRVVDETYGEYLRDLHYEVADSFLEELDELNREVLFRNTMKASVQYAALTRCGLDASRYIDDEDLSGLPTLTTWEPLPVWVLPLLKQTVLSFWKSEKPSVQPSWSSRKIWRKSLLPNRQRYPIM